MDFDKRINIKEAIEGVDDISTNPKLSYAKWDSEGAFARRRTMQNTEKYLIGKIDAHTRNMPSEIRNMYETLFTYMEAIADKETEYIKYGD